MLKNGSFFKISRFTKNEKKDIILHRVPIKIIKPAFNYPTWKIFVDLSMYIVDLNYEYDEESCSIRDVRCKAVIFEIFESSNYIMPLLH